MEILNQLIEHFVAPGRGYGSSIGDDRGYGCGYGSGTASGDGSGYGRGCGSGIGDGNDCGYGYGYGYGRGCVDGYDDGYGMGGLISFNNEPVYYVDGIPTIINKVRGNLAKGYAINDDLTTAPCYIVKHNGLFAHGKTIKEAEQALEEKIFSRMNIDEKIDAFLKKFNLIDSYPAKDFYEWHHKLTGSCKFGRDHFIKNHSIDIENGMYTVQEFVDITKNEFGSPIIKKLDERIKKEESYVASEQM